MKGWWFSQSTPVSSTNNTDHYDITEILLKAALSTIALQVYKYSEITIDYCSETCLSQTLKKTQSFINPTLNIQCSSNNFFFFINLTFINQPPVYYNHKSWSQGDWLQTGFTVLLYIDRYLELTSQLKITWFKCIYKFI